MLDASELADAEGQRLVLKCPQMTIHRGGSAPLRFSGGGTISQQPFGPLKVVLFVPAGWTTDISNQLLREAFATKPGTLLGPNELYALEAIDLNGRVWIATDLFLHARQLLGRETGVIETEANELRTVQVSPGSPTEMRTFSSATPEIPVNDVTERRTTAFDEGGSTSSVDLWRMTEGALELGIRRIPGGLRVTCAVANGTLPIGIDSRIDEALWFCLGVLSDWCIKQERIDGSWCTTLRRNDDYSRNRGKRPLAPWPRGRDNDYSRMYCRYLAFVMKGAPERFHPLSVVWRSVLMAEGVGLEDVARALSIGLEAVAVANFPDLMEEDAAAKAEIDALLIALGTINSSPELKRRVERAVKRFGGPNARTGLKRLVEERFLRDHHRKAWESVRHRVAHGTESKLDVEALLEHCDAVYQALVILTLHVIGYDGNFQDHTTTGWPNRQILADGTLAI